MGSSRAALPVLAVSVLALGLAGCQGSRLPYLSTRTQAPEPLTPAPAGTVAASELPPPGETQDPSAFPDAPETADGASTDLAVAAATAPQVNKNSVVGSWKTAAAGVNCQMFLTLTKYGDNSRGGTRGCTGELANMRSWNVSGSQLQLYDENGSQIATLYSTGGERFDGQTSAGLAISLSR